MSATRAVGAKINGRIAPLLTELQNGDEVEIIRAEGQTPPAAWESLVVTGKARAAIRRATRAAVRRQYAGLGRQILERAFERAGKAFSRREAEGRAAASRPHRRRGRAGGGRPRRDVLRRRGARRSIPTSRRSASPSRGRQAATAGKGWFELRKGDSLKFKLPGEDSGRRRAIPIRGLGGDLPVRFAPDGGAVPGDRIVGILTPGEGVTIYPIQSPALAAFDNEPERWLDVRWDLDDKRAAALPGAHRAAIDQRAGLAGADHHR